MVVLQEKKFRSIDPSKPGFKAALGAYPPAVEILRRVGFKEEANGQMVLAHRNQAPIIAADTVRHSSAAAGGGVVGQCLES